MTPTKMYTEDLFDRLQPEDFESTKRKILVENSRALRLEKLLQRYEHFFPNKGNYARDGSPNTRYHLALKEFKTTEVTNKDIEDLSILLERYQDKESFSILSGLFLSSLINASSDSDIAIHTSHLNKLPNQLCYRISQNKNVIIRGNVGDMFGEQMRKGANIML